MKTRKHWLGPFAISKPACGCARCATTSPTWTRACTARARPATSALFAWSKNPPTSLLSKRRVTTTAPITCCTDRFRRFTASGRNSFAFPTCSSAWKTATSMKSFWHQSDRRRGSYGHVSNRATAADGSEGDADCHRHPGRKRYRICRRDHHAEGDGGPAGALVL